MKKQICCSVILFACLHCHAQSEFSVKVLNPLKSGRTNQTIELSARELVGVTNRNFDGMRIRDEAGKPVLSQSVDSDGDGKSDMLIFQSDFGPDQTKRFTLSATKSGKQTYKKEQYKTYGRFVRERFDDFAWENDRVAHRMYGKALETWKDEPLTSSTVDVWCKKVSRLVINDWYLTGDYHSDHGEGADFYSAGRSRGCGGNGLWFEEKLWTSKNHTNSRVLACGPIRMLFELSYEEFDVNGIKTSELKRISLDAGQNFNRFQSIYKVQVPTQLKTGIGIRRGDVITRQTNTQSGWLATWEPVKGDSKGGSHLGCAVIMNPKQAEGVVEDKLNVLLIGKVPQDSTVTYWAGSAWSKGGQIKTFQDWTACVDRFAQEMLSPVQISVEPIK